MSGGDHSPGISPEEKKEEMMTISYEQKQAAAHRRFSNEQLAISKAMKFYQDKLDKYKFELSLQTSTLIQLILYRDQVQISTYLAYPDTSCSLRNPLCAVAKFCSQLIFISSLFSSGDLPGLISSMHQGKQNANN